MSKKFVNKVEDTVDDALFGLVSLNKNIQFCENSNRVIHLSKFNSKNVSLIAGGGSGHEPYAAGYVGKGLLTAAVAGNVFASPPSRNVQAALEATKSKAGAILFVINYTGDRLNFGLAAERFNASGGNAKVVTVADDVAIDNPNSRVGRRGLAGAVLTIKIAGAMSDQGKSLDEIYEMSRKVVSSLGTLGVSLYPGSLPGKSRETELSNDEIEVGLGIHGEPGKFRAPYECARKIVTGLMGTIQAKMEMKKEEKYVVLVNNLGSVSQLEMGIVNGEVLRWFDSQRISIARFYSGTYMTSLDGHGISVTVLRADDQMIEYLNAPAEGWTPALPLGKVSQVTSKVTDIPSSGTSLNSQLVKNCLDDVIQAIAASQEFNEKVDSSSILKALEKGNQAVQKYGGARVGDRTMVDSLDAMVEELKKGLDQNGGLDVFERAVQASVKAAESTAHQTATVGRASYTSSQSQTKPDAGATAISIWLRAFWEAFKQEMGKK
ncbi:hypothetical protein CAEBREN_03626 [Caenorhabditis brenneri]|uniref:Triokinase/FMN cyclase n=1 Tax=Caenorhabditis brenneri TaxID=135651 RepID=G0M8V1_CAEBE|nr:hypothetical protein CAEBREN_03626 [Caenorhabditis brenneri]